MPVPVLASAEEVDVEIVLAVDGSGSVSQSEFELQLKGYADAFRNPGIQSAMLSGPNGKVVVAMVIWSGANFSKFNTSWFPIASQADAIRTADFFQRFSEQSARNFGGGGGSTGIGAGIVHSMELIRNNQYQGLRKVVDVSGDGVETDPWVARTITLADAHVLAQEHGIVINGLAILNDFPQLDRYYRKEVIHGLGSFVIAAQSFEDFGEAIGRKLWREFSNVTAGLEIETIGRDQ